MVATNQLNLNGHDFFLIASRRTTALRCAPHRSAYRRPATQLKDLFVNFFFLATPRIAPRRGATLRYATRRYHLFVTSQRTPHHNASFRDTALHPTALLHFVRRAATQRYHLFVNLFSPFASPRIAPRRAATPRFAARLCSPCLDSPRLMASFRALAQRNSTICLLQRSAPRHLYTPHFSSQLNDLFVNLQGNAALLRFSPLGSASGSAPRLPATQLNDLFVNLFSRLRSASQLSALPCVTFFRFAMPRSATQRFVCQFIFKAAHRVTLHFSALPRCAPLIVSFQLNEL